MTAPSQSGEPPKKHLLVGPFHICTKRIDRNWLRKELRHAMRERQVRGQPDASPNQAASLMALTISPPRRKDEAKRRRGNLGNNATVHSNLAGCQFCFRSPLPAACAVRQSAAAMTDCLEPIY